MRGSLQASAALVFVSALLAIFFVRERHKPAASDPTTLAADFRTALSSPVMWIILFISVIGQAASMSVQPVLVLQVEAMLGEAGSPFLTGVIMALPGIAFVLSATCELARPLAHATSHHHGLYRYRPRLRTLRFHGDYLAVRPCVFCGQLICGGLPSAGRRHDHDKRRLGFPVRAFGLQISRPPPWAAWSVRCSPGSSPMRGADPLAVFITMGALLLVSPLAVKHQTARMNRKTWTMC